MELREVSKRGGQVRNEDMALKKQVEDLRKQLEETRRQNEEMRHKLEDQRKAVETRATQLDEKEKALIEFEMKLKKRKEQVNKVVMTCVCVWVVVCDLTTKPKNYCNELVVFT